MPIDAEWLAVPAFADRWRLIENDEPARLGYPAVVLVVDQGALQTGAPPPEALY